jgi:hypothetical protein
LEETEEVARTAPLPFAKRRVFARLAIAKEVVVALVARSVVAKKLVDVAFEVVAFCPVKFWKVEEPERRRFVSEARPVLSIEKRVVVAKAAVEDERTKSMVGGIAAPAVVVELAEIEKNANGEVVPMPTREANVLLPVVEVATM